MLAASLTLWALPSPLATSNYPAVGLAQQGILHFLTTFLFAQVDKP